MVKHKPDYDVGNGYVGGFDNIDRIMRDVEASHQRHVDDLQSGMYINCVYCGHRYGPKDEVEATMADALKEHIEQCPKHPMSKRRSAEQAVALLNEMFRLDPVGMKALVNIRVGANEALAGHPTVQVAKSSIGGYVFGILGVLNGIFGCDENNRGYVAAVFHDETEELEGFKVLSV